MGKKIALVLASGGARGLAHIGAIEELTRRGYEISSLSGTSAGALVAGLYATGKLEEAKNWFMSLSKQQLLALNDFSLGRNYVMKGEKIMDAIKDIVPDCKIEDLPLPVSIVASDVIHNKEVVFTSGSLYEAVRASVSIPLFFRPVRKGDMLLVDGGLLNALPLNRVKRQEGDLLVAMNISAPDSLTPQPKRASRIPKLLDKMPLFGKIFEQSTQQTTVTDEIADSINYISLLSRIVDMTIQNNAVAMLEHIHPDIIAEMPMNQYSRFAAFEEANTILEDGRLRMRKAIDQYEAQHA